MSKNQVLKTGEKVLFMIVGIFIALCAIAFVAMEFVRFNADEPIFEVKTKFDFTEQGAIGSQIFRQSRCTSCHRALRNGTNMGLSLDGVGSARSEEWLYQFLKNPEKTYKAKTLDHGSRPKEAAYVSEMSDKDLRSLAIFISELKAEQGSSSAPVPPDGRSEFIDNMVKTWAPEHWKEKYSDVRIKYKKSSDVGEEKEQ